MFFGGERVRGAGEGKSEAVKVGEGGVGGRATDSMPVAQRLNIEEREDALAFEELEGGDVACIFTPFIYISERLQSAN